MSGLVQKFKEMLTPPEDEFDYEYEEDNFEDLSKKNEQKSSQTRASAQNNKVVNIHATAQLQVVLFKPERFGEDTRAIADELIKMHTVVLNLENTNKDVCGVGFMEHCRYFYKAYRCKSVYNSRTAQCGGDYPRDCYDGGKS